MTFLAIIKISYPLFCLVVTLLTGLDSRHLGASKGGGVWGPARHIVAGSGARYRKIERPHPRRRFEAEKLGFARIDLVGPSENPRLVASLFRAPTIPPSQWGAPKLEMRWSLDIHGGVERLR